MNFTSTYLQQVDLPYFGGTVVMPGEFDVLPQFANVLRVCNPIRYGKIEREHCGRKNDHTREVCASCGAPL